jgi:hypothetical protein
MVVEVEEIVLGAKAEAEAEAEVEADKSIGIVFLGQIAANSKIRQAQRNVRQQGTISYPEPLQKPCGA